MKGKLAERLPQQILLAEDSLVDQRIAVVMLQSLGYEPVVVENGRRVFQALGTRPFDVILMNLDMPEIDGLQATAHIRRLWPQGGPRIIAITADDRPEMRQNCLASGMDGFILKPLQLEELTAALAPAGVEPEPEPEPETIDRKVLAKLDTLGGGSTLKRELIDLYLDREPGQIEELRVAIDAGDAKALRMAAHKLKGSAATMGAQKMASCCNDLELAARDEKLGGAEEMLKQIRIASARACHELRAAR